MALGPIPVHLFAQSSFWWSLEFVLLVYFAVVLVVSWFCITEFSYCSKRLQRVVYWLFSFGFRYERKWKAKEYASPELTRELFLDPLKQTLGESADASLLDLACGSGRISLLVLGTDWFRGRIDAVDFSEPMLKNFRHFLEKFPEDVRGRVAMTQQDLTQWRAPAEQRYDAIALMEVGEFIPNIRAVLAEISRALKPGGLLLMTRPTGAFAWIFVGRPQTRRRFLRLLEELHFDLIELRPWTSRYQVVHARKWVEASTASSATTQQPAVAESSVPSAV